MERNECSGTVGVNEKQLNLEIDNWSCKVTSPETRPQILKARAPDSDGY